jgi:hypothetical protein
MPSSFEVPEPILHAPFDESAYHWHIREGEEPQKRQGRWPSIVYPPPDEREDKHVDWRLTDGTIPPSTEYAPGYELVVVNLLRERVEVRRQQEYGGKHPKRRRAAALQKRLNHFSCAPCALSLQIAHAPTAGTTRIE